MLLFIFLFLGFGVLGAIVRKYFWELATVAVLIWLFYGPWHWAHVF